ncbi:MAG: hypothetical protein DRP15_04380 [Candidatus Aenigmatarchaeota archaeon]|nr:MAG: hypothetical protein DRP15_04380 [Candidatus Aenigmarchaeota archaeon]
MKELIMVLVLGALIVWCGVQAFRGNPTPVAQEEVSTEVVDGGAEVVRRTLILETEKGFIVRWETATGAYVVHFETE